MASRDHILAALRASGPIPAPQPGLTKLGHTPPDQIEAFAKHLEAAGGVCWQCTDLRKARHRLESDPELLRATRRYCILPEMPVGNAAVDASTDSATLDTIDAAILPGELAVAENGAVWVSHDSLAHRALPFICTSLYLVVPVSLLVPDLHAAYAKLQAESRSGGCFIAGPSKTADIEQCLVIGAQGPKHATVILVGIGA